MNVLVFSSCWPNTEEPNLGVFVRHRALALSRQSGVSIRVVAPVPWFPKSLARSFVPGHWQKKARIPDQETQSGLTVEHPRYLSAPKIGMRYYGDWMAQGAESIIRRLHAEKPFDLIDAHFIYPEGRAALRLGKMLNVPVVLTARGSDINVFSELPYIRPILTETLGKAAGLIAVSDGLKEGMVSLGIAGEKIKVIRNGINQQTFYLRDRAQARRQLGLDPDRKIIVTVGYLIPRKGVNHLIDALALIRQRSPQTDLAVYALGEGPERATLEAQIARLGLQQHFFLPGACPQSDLAAWYAAADLFCFASSGEGCPNVVVEALACGLPVIAADIPGVDELVSHPSFGQLIPTAGVLAEGFAEKISDALKTEWDRSFIAAHKGGRSWDIVAEDVMQAFAEFGVLKKEARDIMQHA